VLVRIAVQLRPNYAPSIDQAIYIHELLFLTNRPSVHHFLVVLHIYSFIFHKKTWCYLCNQPCIIQNEQAKPDYRYFARMKLRRLIERAGGCKKSGEISK